MLVGINTRKNSCGKPVHPLLTAGKNRDLFYFILTARYRFRSGGSSRIAVPTAELAGDQRQIPAGTSNPSQPKEHQQLELALPHVAEDSSAPVPASISALYHSLIRHQKNMKICQMRSRTLSMPQNAPVISNQITRELYNRQRRTENLC